jgi:prophage regulatory protein
MSRLLRLKEVMELTSMPRSTIYAYMKKGLFPQKKNLTQKSVVWREDEIKKWIDSRVEAS